MTPAAGTWQKSWHSTEPRAGRRSLAGHAGNPPSLDGSTHRREQAVAGTVAPLYAQVLDGGIAGWRNYPTKRDTDAARWKQRLGEVTAYLAAGNEFSRHNKTQDQ